MSLTTVILDYREINNYEPKYVLKILRKNELGRNGVFCIYLHHFPYKVSNFLSYNYFKELGDMSGIDACGQTHVYHQKVRAIVTDGTIVCGDNYVPNDQLKIELGK